MELDLRTLRAHYAAELDDGVHNCNAQVCNALYRKALGGNVRAQIFWLRTRAGWVDRQVVDTTITTVIQVPDVEQLRARLDAALAGRAAGEAQAATTH